MYNLFSLYFSETTFEKAVINNNIQIFPPFTHFLELSPIGRSLRPQSFSVKICQFDNSRSLFSWIRHVKFKELNLENHKKLYKNVVCCKSPE